MDSYSEARYHVIGGNPWRVFNGTTTFSSLRTLGVNLTKKEAEECVNRLYDESGGLLLVVNAATGATDEV